MTQSSIDEHNAAMVEAFAKVLNAEQALVSAEHEKREADAIHSLKVAEAKTELAKAWEQIETLMAETGEVEVVLPGTVTDYKIGRTKPGVSVKVVDPDAVPDEFVERKPKLKDIGNHLRTLDKEKKPLPNWAAFEKGQGKLTWSAIKKGKA